MAYLSLAPFQIQIAHTYTHIFRYSVIKEAGTRASYGPSPLMPSPLRLKQSRQMQVLGIARKRTAPSNR